MKNSMLVIKYRWWIIAATALMVLFAIFQMPRITINPDLESYLPDQIESRKNSKTISDIFGDEEPLLIVIESEDVLSESTLSRIDDLTYQFEMEDAISSVLSLMQMQRIHSEEGMMLVDPLIQFTPQTDEERETLRQEIKDNELVYGLLVSEDFKKSVIILTSNKTLADDELMNRIKTVITDNPGDENIYITGQAYLRDEANRNISHDLLLLLPVGIVLMFFMLWISFRELKAVLLPFSVVIFSIIISIGLIPLMGWELSIVGVLIPIMMIAIANNYGVYFIARYQDLNALEPNLSMQKIVQLSVSYLTRPIVFCGLTTIVGILGLVTHLLLPAQQMGIVTAIGISFALLVSLLFIPAAMSLMKKGKPHRALESGSKNIITRILNGVSNLITKSPKLVMLIFALFLFVATSGLLFFKVAPDSNKVLPLSHPFNKAIQIVDNDFGGSKVLQILIEGDAKDPLFLSKLQSTENKLKELPNVGYAMSLATIIIEISKAMNDENSEAYGVIPDTREAVAQYLELYNMSGNPEELERLVDFNYTKVMMNIQFKANSIAEIDEVLETIDASLLNDNKFDYLAGGYALVEKEMSKSILKGQYYSLLFAFFAIIILLAIIFRSFVAGLMGSIPLVFAVFSTFGLMGWFGIELNIVTALLSSISIGLGVDFTIHIFWRIKYELEQGKKYTTSIRNTLITIGRGITINAFSVMIGFAVLFLSAFPLIRSFAFLIILSLFLCLISALIFIPALSLLIKPKFLNK